MRLKNLCAYITASLPLKCAVVKQKGHLLKKGGKDQVLVKFTVLVISVAEWLAGWTTKSAIRGSPAVAEIAISNSVLGNYLIGQCR